MIQLNLNNVFAVDSKHGLSKSEFEGHASDLASHLEGVQGRGQGFYKTIDETEDLDAILKYAKSVEGKYDDIILLGIGGSSLGPITLRDCFGHFVKGSEPRLHVLENIDPDFLVDIMESVDLARSLVIVVTKSGGTPETLAEYMLLRSLYDEADLPISDHFVFVTDPEKGFLREIANRDSVPSFGIPADVGGRFSVLTSVGLLPAVLIGIDVQEMLAGARDMRDAFLSQDFKKNLPYQLAVVQEGLRRKGKTQNVLMPYATKLRSFSDWFAQLLAESTGKFDSTGNNVGLTPIPSLGVTDQHSQLQLFAEGPNDKLIMFMNVGEFARDIEIPVVESGDKVDFLKGKSFTQLLHAEQKGTAASLTERDRPNLGVEIPEITPYALGQLFLLFEGATAFLGEMMDIDAFDQPGVERSKVLTRENL